MRETSEFVGACCRWPQDAAAQRALKGAAQGIRDWDAAREAVKGHRVIPLVAMAVKDLDAVPQAFRDWAQRNARMAAHQAMRMTRDCVAVDTLLKAAGLQPVHVKGPVLGQLAFGSVAMKYSRDLDIYVPQADAMAAMGALETAGYHCPGQSGPITERQASAVIRNFKDLKFVAPSGTLIELHWHLSDTKSLLSAMEDDLQLQSVKIAGAVEVQTFANTQMVTYLCVHGAMHHWVRLKWLADLAAFLMQLDPVERDRVLAEIAGGRNKDALAQALALCDTVFGTEYAPDMSPRARALYEYALERIDEPDDVPRTILGDLRLFKNLHATRHLYSSPLAALWAQRSYLVGQDDVLDWPMPAPLNGLYPLIRLPSFVLRRLKKRVFARARSAKSWPM